MKLFIKPGSVKYVDVGFSCVHQGGKELPADKLTDPSFNYRSKLLILVPTKDHQT